MFEHILAISSGLLSQSRLAFITCTLSPNILFLQMSQIVPFLFQCVCTFVFFLLTLNVSNYQNMMCL